MKINIKSSQPKVFKGLGIYGSPDKVFLNYYSSNLDKYVSSALSKNGVEFEKAISGFSLIGLGGTTPEKSALESMRITKVDGKKYILSYILNANKKTGYLAMSSNGTNWETFYKMPPGKLAGVLIQSYKFNEKFVMVSGGNDIFVGLSDELSKWKFTPLALPQGQYTVDFVSVNRNEISVIYHNFFDHEGKKHIELNVLNLDIKNPSTVLWKMPSSLCHLANDWGEKNTTCLGIIPYEDKFLSYWDIPDDGIYVISFPLFVNEEKYSGRVLKLDKHIKNPILTPSEKNSWEKEAVFNPAAFEDGDKVYLLYRAVGTEYISVIGLTQSEDGMTFESRSPEPIYKASQEFDLLSPKFTHKNPSKYVSGPGFGGVEDPRVTVINDRLYMVYVAFNGYDAPRLALTSILLKDFYAKKYLWEAPVLISPPGVVDKSGCILPEKINGKYVIFHRIYPDILIDYVDNLNFDGTFWLKGEQKISPRPGMWDSRKVGVGAPPLKTDHGWLLIYQAVGEADPGKYKVGAMILDLKNPGKVLYRSAHPIMEPTEHYENSLAKFGVIYPCGAVIINGELLVYYGGSDSVVCLAKAKLEDFLQELMTTGDSKLTPVNFS